MVKAYAKINLGLHILRKREDGYHDIETVFHRVNLYDEITLEPSSTISLSCNDPGIPLDDRNLCVRAAQILQQACGTKLGARISLNKRIPAGAGLGGGSSDAAATLGGLLRLWNEHVDEHALREVAIQLGSDVPYFLNDGTAYATGRGEVLHYFTLDVPYWIVLVYPHLHISTAWAYENATVRGSQLTGRTRPDRIRIKEALVENILDLRLLSAHLENDFEAPVFQAHPLVKEVREKLYGSGAGFAQMSGSGSAVYGLFKDGPSARRTVDDLGRSCAAFLTAPHFQPERSKMPGR